MYNFKRRAQQEVPQQSEEFALIEEEQQEEAQIDQDDHEHNNAKNSNDNDEQNAGVDSSVDMSLENALCITTTADSVDNVKNDNNNEQVHYTGAQSVNETEPLAHDADERTVLMYYRQEVQKHLLVPPRPWRQIRLDLPSTVAELQLYPPQPEIVQYNEPIVPSPCIVILLDGTKPAEMNNNEYMAQMVNYLFELLRYQNASTAMTMVRFVKRGSELSQLVVTFGQDIPLATRILVEIQSAGLAAGFGQPIHEHPPNATFQIIDYKMIMHDGLGITVEDIQLLLEPFRQSDQGDMVVIEGYEPGVYYAPVKRPETVFTFLWNPFCSFLLQSGLFEKYGVLITMAYCPHEFLTKGVPFYLQRKQKEVEEVHDVNLYSQVQSAAVISPPPPLPQSAIITKEEEQQQQNPLPIDMNNKHNINNNKNSNNHEEYNRFVEDNDNEDENANADLYGEKEHYEPWIDRAKDEIDIFDTHTENLTESKVSPLSFNARHTQVNANQTIGALVLNDDDDDDDLNDNNKEKVLLHDNNNINANIPIQNRFYGSSDINSINQNYNFYNYNKNISSFNNQNYGPHPIAFSSQSFTMTGNHDNYMTHDAPHNISLAPPIQLNLNPTFSSIPEQTSLYSPQMNTFVSSGNDDNNNNVTLQNVGNQPVMHETQRTQEPILPDILPEPANVVFYNQQQQEQQQEMLSIQPNNNAHYQFDKPILSETPILPLEQPEQDKIKGDVQGVPLQQNEYGNMQWPFATPSPHYLPHCAPMPFAQPQQGWMSSEFPTPSSMQPFSGFNNTAPMPCAMMPPPPSHTFPVMMEQINASGANMPYTTSTPSLHTWNTNNYNNNNSYNNDNQFALEAFQPSLEVKQQEQEQQPSSLLLETEQNAPITMTAEDARAMIEEIEEQIHIAFVEYKSFHESTDNDETCVLLDMSPEQVVEYNSASSSSSSSQLLPYTSAIHVLMQFIIASHDRIQFVLQRTEPEFTELQMQLAQLLLGSAASVVQETQNEKNSVQESTEETIEIKTEEEQKEKETEEKTKNKSKIAVALLPYLLQAQEGVYITSTLAAYYSDKLSHVLVRFMMLYLCQTNIIQTIVVPCLLHDTSSHNPLVERFMKYWVTLAMWVQNYISLQATHDAETELPRQRQLKRKMWNNYTEPFTTANTTSISAESTAQNDKVKEALVSTATKRLLSQVGNALESMMAVMSVKQRSWCKEYSECNNAITSFKEHMLQSTLRKQKSNTNEEPHDVEILTEDDVDTIRSMRMLWELDGAAWRTLLRLYLNADILNGEQLALVLFSHVAWTRELYYFVLSTTIPSQVAQSLNLETARFCGTFLRMFEEKMLIGSSENQIITPSKEEEKEEEESETVTGNNDIDNNETEKHVQENAKLIISKDCPLEEKNATELVQSALCHIVFPHIYEAFQRAYGLNRDIHFSSVMNLLSLPPPLPPQPPPPFPTKYNNKYNRANAHNSQQEHKTSEQKLQQEEKESERQKYEMEDKRYSRNKSDMKGNNNVDEDKNEEITEKESKEELELEEQPRWRAEWSTLMSTYPQSGEPFPPLPPGWRSALSRSYGHYYFISSNSNNNNNSGKPTYKHPVSRKEYMATPQAFVKAFSKEITLPRIQAHALAELKRMRDANQSDDKEVNETTPQGEKDCKNETNSVEVEVVEPTQLMVNQWWHDQRIRHFSLDTAVMDLLKITYRVGGSNSSVSNNNENSNTNERKVNGKEELRECLRVLDRYPISGAPFPPLSGDWRVKMDTESGVYVFYSNSVSSTLFHPRTHRMYRVSPQAFAELHSLTVEAIALHSQCSVREVEHWLGDQGYRRTAIDMAVVEMIPVNYKWYDELDKPYLHHAHHHHHHRNSSRHERSDNYCRHRSSNSRHDSYAHKYRREENSSEYNNDGNKHDKQDDEDNRPTQRYRSEHDSTRRNFEKDSNTSGNTQWRRENRRYQEK